MRGADAAPLIDEDLLVVVYDLTTIRAGGLSQQEVDVRHFSLSKEGGSPASSCWAGADG